MSEIMVSRLSADEARSLTDEVKASAAELWARLLALYEGGAHTALGYSSWGAYFETEFGGSDATAYRILQSARVLDQLPMGSSGPASERVARELTPLLREGPERVEEVWAEVVEEYGAQPTAEQVREVRERPKDVGVRKVEQQKRLVSGIAEKARLIVELAPHLDHEAIGAIPQEETDQWVSQLSSARTVLTRVLGSL